jgi:hypothetical protein
MDNRRARLLLVVFSLCALLAGGQTGEARAVMGGPGGGGAGPAGASGPCSTLGVLGLSTGVAASASTVTFGVGADPQCSWQATSSIIQNITPAQGMGNTAVYGTVPDNSDTQPRTVVLTVRSADGTVTRTASVVQAGAITDCTGVVVQPTVLWNGGGFINVTVPVGWSWYWYPHTPLMIYNCSPVYPTGVSCSWGCGIESRVGWAEVIAYGQGRRCSAVIEGNQTICFTGEAGTGPAAGPPAGR